MQKIFVLKNLNVEIFLSFRHTRLDMKEEVEKRDMIQFFLFKRSKFFFDA